MVIQIDSLEVENIGCFRGQHQLLLQDNAQSPTVVRGRGATGKTTLCNAIYLCLSGHRRNGFLPNKQRIELMDRGDSIDSKISMVISDTETDSRFQLIRTIRSSRTLRGPAHAIDSLTAKEEIEGKWVETRSAPVLDSVFPTHSLPFSILGPESTMGNDNWRDLGLNQVVENLGEAAARQSASRGVELPKFYSNNEALRKELIERSNEQLDRIDNRYLVELGEDGLVGKPNYGNKDGTVQGLPAGQIQVIFQTTALMAGELMPATPPLVGDMLYCRLDVEHRRKMFGILEELDRQTLLFLSEGEFIG